MTKRKLIKYNASNWSGEEKVVEVEKSCLFGLNNHYFTFDGDRYQLLEYTLKETIRTAAPSHDYHEYCSGYAVVSFNREDLEMFQYMEGGPYHVELYGIQRSDVNPVVAFLKLMDSIY